MDDGTNHQPIHAFVTSPSRSSDNEAAPSGATPGARPPGAPETAAGPVHPPPPARGAGCEHRELERLRGEHQRLQREVADLSGELAATRAACQAEVAARQTAEDACEQCGRLLRDAHRLESLGVLAGGLAHQFNNLLTIISGHVGLAAGEAAPGTTLAHSVAEIRHAVQRGAGLCRQMQDAAGHSFAVRRELEPKALLDQALGLVGGGEAGRSVVEYVPGAAVLPRVRGVAAQLQQAVAAIVQNALEAVPRTEGRVRVALHDVPLDQRQAAQLSSPVPAGHYVCFEVSDNGGGIAPVALGRVYEPFFTTKGLGRGLGLAAAAGIARSHGGGIAVESTPGLGSTFRFYLPAVGPAAIAN